jgi:hypothetical protein
VNNNGNLKSIFFCARRTFGSLCLNLKVALHPLLEVVFRLGVGAHELLHILIGAATFLGEDFRMDP